MSFFQGSENGRVSRGCFCLAVVSFQSLQTGRELHKKCWKRWKNKMKPTNPNADTYVEKHKFNTYLSQFPANPLVEHPDLTH